MTLFQDSTNPFDFYNIHVSTSSIERSILIRLATAVQCQVHILLYLPDCESCQTRGTIMMFPLFSRTQQQLKLKTTKLGSLISFCLGVLAIAVSYDRLCI
jgi:hypothetical protein